MKLATQFSRQRVTRRAAFTLLEVLVVVAIVVILATVSSFAYFRYLSDAKKTEAQLKAKTLDTAIKSYMANPNYVNDGSFQLANLIQPSWGGTSYLPNGQMDLLDPWNKEYSIQLTQGLDGAPVYMIATTADDGTHISQFGVGPNARW